MKVSKNTTANEEKIFNILMNSFISEYEYYSKKKYTKSVKPIYNKTLNSKLGSKRKVSVTLSKFEDSKTYEVTTKFGDEINIMSYSIVNENGVNKIVYEERFYYESGKKSVNNAFMQLIWMLPNKMNAKKRLNKLEQLALIY